MKTPNRRCPEEFRTEPQSGPPRSALLRFIRAHPGKEYSDWIAETQTGRRWAKEGVFRLERRNTKA